MKQEFTLGLEFTDGNFDTRTVKANNLEEAIRIVIENNEAQVKNPNFPSAKEISTVEKF